MIEEREIAGGRKDVGLNFGCLDFFLMLWVNQVQLTLCYERLKNDEKF